MKLNRLLLVILALTMAVAVNAKQVSQSQAMQIALNYLNQKATKGIQGVNPAAPDLRLCPMTRGANTDYYVFNNGDNDGFIVVAGDDRAVPVLGYSDSGSLDPENMPEGLKFMLETYAQEMQYLRNKPQAAPASAPLAHNPAVKPLLKCNWGQNAPFNLYCPNDEDENGNTFRCVTGCTATAAAQIMYYHKWPERGEGSITYEWQNHGGTQIGGEFDHPFPWSDMLDNYISGQYTTKQGEAVATLMVDVGAAAQMQYGKTSNASLFWMMTGMRQYFHYNKGMKFVMRDTKTLAEWETLIFNELNNKRPILYSGFTPKSGGHTFVLDGYNADGYFHFNWGWTSLSNGYFLITALNPSEQGTGSFEGGYNTTQAMVINICPQTDGVEPEQYIELTCRSFMPEETSINLGEIMNINLFGLMGSGAGFGNHASINHVFMLTDANDAIVERYTVYNMSLSLGSRYTYSVERKNPIKARIGANLADGDYHLRLMYKLQSEDDSKYRSYDHSALSPGYVAVHVENGKMTFSQPTAGNSNLKVSKFEYPETVGDNAYFPATVTFTNDGDEFYGNIHIAFKGGSYPQYTDRYSSLINVPKDGEVMIKCTMFAPRGAGEYQMAVLDDAGNVIDGPRKIVVTESDNYQLEAATQLTPGSYYMTPDNVTAHVDLRNTGTQAYTGCIYYQIRQNGNRRASGISDIVTIPAGETRRVDFKTRFEGQPNVEYNFYLYNVKNDTEEDMTRINAPFMIADEQTGVDEISSNKVSLNVSGGVLHVTGANRVDIYSVSGAWVASGNNAELPAGVYIVVTDDTVHKIAVK